MINVFTTVLVTSKLKISEGFCTVRIDVLCALHNITVINTNTIGTRPLPCIKVPNIAMEPRQVERIIPKVEYPI